MEDNKESHPTVRTDEPSSSESDDSETLERMQAFSAAGKSSPSGSVRRYDEYASFLTRSQRAHELGREPPLSKEEECKRKVHFITIGDTDDVLVVLHEIPALTHAEKLKCYMTPENWDSIDTDIELTRKRWENHVSGKLPFDKENNTLRGLENVLDPESKDRGLVPRHETNVIGESNRQKRENEYIHWDKFRLVSLKTSAEEMARARRLAEQDAEEAVSCWQHKAILNKADRQAPVAKDDKKRFHVFRKIFNKI